MNKNFGGILKVLWREHQGATVGTVSTDFPCASYSSTTIESSTDTVSDPDARGEGGRLPKKERKWGE